MNCDTEIDDETKDNMNSEYIVHTHPHPDFSGQRYEDHYCDEGCFNAMYDPENSADEIYEVSVRDVSGLFNSFDDATEYGETLIKKLHGDEATVEWRFTEHVDYMDGWVDDCLVVGQIKRRVLNHDVEPAMKQFHNDD